MADNNRLRRQAEILGELDCSVRSFSPCFYDAKWACRRPGLMKKNSESPPYGWVVVEVFEVSVDGDLLGDFETIREGLLLLWMAVSSQGRVKGFHDTRPRGYIAENGVAVGDEDTVAVEQAVMGLTDTGIVISGDVSDFGRQFFEESGEFFDARKWVVDMKG